MDPNGGNGWGDRTFWIAPVDDSGVQVHFGDGTAELSVSNLAAEDFVNLAASLGPNWQTAFVNATVSFDVVWSGPITRQVSVTNGTNGDQFQGSYVENQASVTWSASNANGFSFTANAGDFSTSVSPFAELGQEQNGSFFGGDTPAEQGGAAAPVFATQAATRGLDSAKFAAPPVTATSARGGADLASYGSLDRGVGQLLAARENVSTGRAADSMVAAVRSAHERLFELASDPAALSAGLFTEIGRPGEALSFR